VKYLNPEILQKVLESDIAAGSDAAVPQFTGLSIDSRKIKPGDIFFAIKGEKHDGHDFVVGAFKRGAAAAVVNRVKMDVFAEKKPGLILAVEDTHEALLNLAGYIRRRSDARFAAITGSNGKTTTKEMFYSIVKCRHSVYRSPGNLNNLFGLPISLGKMPEVDYAIFELGISVPGEMLRLASIIKPELALITNIGPTHLETLKTMDNVVKAKFELIDRLPVGAVVVLNADDQLLVAEAGRRNLDYIGFGIKSECRFKARHIRTDKRKQLSFEVCGQKIAMPLFGRVNVYNALGAIAASSVWGCEPEEWATGLSECRPMEMRLALEDYEGLTFLVDCYNANPESIKAALEILGEFETEGRKIAVLGDMLELGQASKKMHFDVGRRVAEAGIDFLFCLGRESVETAAGALSAGTKKENVFHYLTHQDLMDGLLGIIARGDMILLKGSRGMELEKIVIGLKGSAFKSN